MRYICAIWLSFLSLPRPFPRDGSWQWLFSRNGRKAKETLLGAGFGPASASAPVEALFAVADAIYSGPVPWNKGGEIVSGLQYIFLWLTTGISESEILRSDGSHFLPPLLRQPPFSAPFSYWLSIWQPPPPPYLAPYGRFVHIFHFFFFVQYRYHLHFSTALPKTVYGAYKAMYAYVIVHLIYRKRLH